MAPPRLRFMVRRPDSGTPPRRPPWVLLIRPSVPSPAGIRGLGGRRSLGSPRIRPARANLARLAKTKKTENPPEPWSAHGGAQCASSRSIRSIWRRASRCPLVEFDPRHALFQTLTFNMAPSIARTPRPQAEGGPLQYSVRAMIVDPVNTLSIFRGSFIYVDNPGLPRTDIGAVRGMKDGSGDQSGGAAMAS